jgi:hypothetical protein
MVGSHGRPLTDPAQDFEAALGIVERRAVHGHDEVPGLQAETGELCAVAARVDAVTAQRATSKDGWGEGLGARRWILDQELAHAVGNRRVRCRRLAADLPRVALRLASAAGEPRQQRRLARPLRSRITRSG